jgi:hypothetical protein
MVKVYGLFPTTLHMHTSIRYVPGNNAFFVMNVFANFSVQSAINISVKKNAIFYACFCANNIICHNQINIY